MSAEKHSSALVKIIYRVVLNTAIVFVFMRYFSSYFLLEGGAKAIVLVGLTLAFLNWLVVPVLSVLTLPIKFFAWIVAFLLVNTVALWVTVWFVTSLGVEGISLEISGGIAGWLILSFVLGFCNWVVRAILK